MSLFQVTVRARNEQNILGEEYSEAVRRLDMFIQSNVSVDYGGKTYRYKDLCLGRDGQGCPGNKHIQVISELYQHGFNITYPTVQFGNMYVFLLFYLTFTLISK